VNLGEILLDVDVLVANNIMPSVKVRWINQIQRQCYRDLPIDDEIYPFCVDPCQRVYAVPDNCSLDNISSVLIGGIEYDPVADGEVHTPRYFWSNVAGQFMVNSVPEQCSTGLITYRPTPQELKADQLSSVPMLPVDYHQLLVDGCAARVAKAEGDDRKAPMYEMSFEKLFAKAKRDLAKPLPDMRVE